MLFEWLIFYKYREEIQAFLIQNRKRFSTVSVSLFLWSFSGRADWLQVADIGMPTLENPPRWVKRNKFTILNLSSAGVLGVVLSISEFWTTDRRGTKLVLCKTSPPHLSLIHTFPQMMEVWQPWTVVVPRSFLFLRLGFFQDLSPGLRWYLTVFTLPQICLKSSIRVSVSRRQFYLFFLSCLFLGFPHVIHGNGLLIKCPARVT